MAEKMPRATARGRSRLTSALRRSSDSPGRPPGVHARERARVSSPSVRSEPGWRRLCRRGSQAGAPAIGARTQSWPPSTCARRGERLRERAEDCLRGVDLRRPSGCDVLGQKRPSAASGLQRLRFRERRLAPNFSPPLQPCRRESIAPSRAPARSDGTNGRRCSNRAGPVTFAVWASSSPLRASWVDPVSRLMCS